MADTGRRVALLARPGPARDAVRGALLEIGADVVAEDDPTSAAPDAVRGASPDVLMIVLDAVSEGALDRFDSLLGDPSIEVMFEEADVAAARDGWEAARWRRHLAAKLGHRDDVLPPVAGAEVASTPATDTLSMQIEALISTEAGEFPPEAQADVPATAAGGDDFRVFTASTEASDAAVEDYVLSVHGLELEPSALDAPLPDVQGLDIESGALDSPPSAETLDLDTTAFDALPPVTGPDFSANDFDPLLAELDAELPDVPLPEAPALPEADWQGGLIDGFAPIEPVPAAEAPQPSTQPDAAPARSGFGELSLSDDASPIGVASSGNVRRADLDDLERRISALELVDDTVPPPIPPAPVVDGAVLVLAGIGGPDAVRQLLSALPARFDRPVLVRQRLDGARYDRLVAQLQRASALPVALAEAGRPLQGGQVYVVGDEIGLDEAGQAFVAGGADRLVERLPPAGSAVVVLSGADVALVDAIDALRDRGAFVGAQSSENCYDAAASGLLAARGAVEASPAQLATQLVGRWSR